MNKTIEASRRRRLLGALVVGGLLTLLAAPTAFASSGTAVGTVTPSVGAGTTKTYTFTLSTTSGQASSFNLTAPSGWSISSVDTSSQAGVSLFSSTEIRGRGITASSSTTLTVTFTATAPCEASSTTWGLQAKSGGNFTGSSFSIDSTNLSTTLSGTCSAAFFTGRGPADAAFNGDTKAYITSVPYSPTGAAIEVQVKDAEDNARAGISVSLTLSTNPTSANLVAPTVTSDANGLADFSPVTINKTGLKYKITPEIGTNVTETPSDFFNVFQEESSCSGSCTVHGNSNDIHSTVTANGQTGTLSVLVSGLSGDLIDCGSSVPTGYNYMPASGEVTAWQYTGTGAQIVSVLIDKSLIKAILNRGSSHLDFCFQTDPGKPPFTDKFGQLTNGPALLSDCSSTITSNCIISETGTNSGDRLVTVNVEDGKGRS